MLNFACIVPGDCALSGVDGVKGAGAGASFVAGISFIAGTSLAGTVGTADAMAPFVFGALRLYSSTG